MIFGVVEMFTADPKSGEGWVGGLIDAVFVGGPLLAVSAGLRSAQARTVRRTAIAAAFFMSVSIFVLVMQLLDPNETAADRGLSTGGVAVYLGVLLVALAVMNSGRRQPK